MVVHKRKKNSRQRGHTNHGWGTGRARHRGSGHRGGKGMAGSGKRADTKKPSIWKEVYFGKHGFVSKTPKVKMNPVNINYIEQHLNKFVSSSMAKKENGFYSIDIEKLGFNKLLGEGKAYNKFKIKTPYASKTAIEKIKNAGGEIIGLESISESQH